ncbi:MAG: tRNA-(ms[2]io[6]A)-hydroxylase [Oligoflexales bacterium]
MEFPLKEATPEGWADFVIQDMPSFMQDHAACEQKAAALAMSFVAKYPDRTILVDPMVSLAREELEHFAQVWRLMRKQGLALSAEHHKDEYINRILKSLRHGREERLLDRLVMSALVEARGYERFLLLSDVLEGDMKSFYRTLGLSEAGHYKIFIKIARHYFEEKDLQESIDRIATVESEVMLDVPFGARLH